jgi:ATP adenylyltransferase
MSGTRNESLPPPPDAASSAAHPNETSHRLWAPWRMRYVAGGHREDGCIFCNRLAENDDVRTLILHRGARAFVIMNLFPYNTGHVMIVPNAHVASPEDADPDMLAEMAALRGPVLRALRRALAPEGFNLGLNVGAVAGAGVSDHLHEHVVPRWGGDANFMPILAATSVMPELIPVTYAKLRAELERELLGATTVSTLVVSPDREFALADANGRLPQVAASEGEPLWRAALREVHDRGAIDAELAGWAGAIRAGADPPVLLFRADFPAKGTASPTSRLVTIADLAPPLDEGGVAALDRLGAAETP